MYGIRTEMLGCRKQVRLILRARARKRIERWCLDRSVSFWQFHGKREAVRLPILNVRLHWQAFYCLLCHDLQIAVANIEDDKLTARFRHVGQSDGQSRKARFSSIRLTVNSTSIERSGQAHS